MYKNNFPENLIKGRIAETIFELMFREVTDFEVYPLGYEHTTPILRQYRDQSDHIQPHKEILDKVLANFSNAPDFLLTKPDKSEIYIVEVKYRHTPKDEDILEIAKDLNQSWHPSNLFLATSQGFFYNTCYTIQSNQGQIQPLKESIISKEKQEYYHTLLMRFEK